MSWHVEAADALVWLRGLATESVDLLLTDPPYFEVKSEGWDHAWASDEAFLAWMEELAVEWARVLRPNGSLYVFASPQMAARVEVLIGKRLRVLTHIVWRKSAGWHLRAEKEALRSWMPQTERIIFAERPDVSAVLRACRQKAGVSMRDAAALFPSRTGGMTGCVSNWELGLNVPSEDQYRKLASLYALPAYEDFLRDSIRPFEVSKDVPYTDVWEYPPVEPYPGKHVCEKPVGMLEAMIQASSLKEGLVVDCFAGSGSTGDAAVRLGRRFQGCDLDPGWVEVARARIAKAETFGRSARVGKPAAPDGKQLGLFRRVGHEHG